MTVKKIIDKLLKFNSDSEVLISITKNDEVIKRSVDIDIFENWDKSIHISIDEKNL